MNIEQKIDEILEAINSKSDKFSFSDIWDNFFRLENIVFQCDKERPGSPLIINYNNQPTILVFTSIEKARTFAEKSTIPNLLNDDGTPVTLTLGNNEAINFIVKHFQNGIKQFLLNYGSDFLFWSSSQDFIRGFNRYNGFVATPGVHISDNFDVLIKQLQEDSSETLWRDFWKKVIQLEKLYVVCPPDAPQKPDIQLIEIKKDQRHAFGIVFTNEQHARAYAARVGYISPEGQFNMIAAPCSVWIDSFAKAGEKGLYGIYFNLLTRPFYETLPNLIKLNQIFGNKNNSQNTEPVSPDPKQLSTIDFDALSAKVRAENSQAAMDELWRNVYRLSEWHFVARGSDDHPTPFVGMVENKPFIMAFTSIDRAQAFAKNNKLLNESGNAKILSIKTGKPDYFREFVYQGVFGILFNDGPNGFFAPLENVKNMNDYYNNKK